MHRPAMVMGWTGTNHANMKHCKHLAAFSLFGLSACLMPGSPPIQDFMERTAEFTRVNPTVIAVLQVEDRSRGEEVKPLLDSMRKQLGASLLLRKYSALGSIYVDSKMRRAIQNASTGSRSIIETQYLASLAQQAGEDAILAVQVTHWNQDELLMSNKVHFVVKATLFGSADKIPLWTGSIRGFVLAGGKGAAPRDPAERARSAAREMIKALIKKLPMHRNS